MAVACFEIFIQTVDFLKPKDYKNNFLFSSELLNMYNLSTT